MKRISIPTAVRGAAAALWTASAVWTTVSVHHVIGNWTTSSVVAALIESAYGLATVWFHTSRTKLSAAALVASLVPVVAALAYADQDMFGPVGFAFAAGPVIAEGGFLLAAHIGLDPAAPTAEQRTELAQLLRESAHRSAVRAAELETELSEIRADSVRQMALDSAVADVRLQRNELARKLSLTEPIEPVRVELTATETERASLVSRSEPVTEPVPIQIASRTERATEPVVSPANEPATGSFGFQPDRAELKRIRTEKLRQLLATEPGASKARISAMTGIPQGSVDRYRKSL